MRVLSSDAVKKVGLPCDVDVGEKMDVWMGLRNKRAG